jgi:redox-sensitive bicupin YhaK (pirin superfamily)
MTTTYYPASKRGTSNLGWLDSRHSFSFGEFFDPKRHHFRSLRVLNEDRVAPGGGFPTHPHNDMEIISYVLEGAMEHHDSMGNGSVIRAGEFQRMTAGSGVTHSEFNSSKSDPLHFLQIWIIPESKGLTPSYEEWTLPEADTTGLHLVASPDARNGSMTVHQQALLYLGKHAADGAVQHTASLGQNFWIQMIDGQLSVNGQQLLAGDSLSLEDTAQLELATGDQPAHYLLFEFA